jgi:predicted transposase YbfD/YdcC
VLRSNLQALLREKTKRKETVPFREYISSLPHSSEQARAIAHRHWSIENNLHWVLDVTYNEDKSCIRGKNKAENIHIIRK